MQQLSLKVVNDVGLHARPAAEFVKEASRFESNTQVRNATADSQWVDAKSILSVLILSVEKDHEIELKVEGADEERALESLRELIETDLAGRL